LFLGELTSERNENPVNSQKRKLSSLSTAGGKRKTVTKENPSRLQAGKKNLLQKGFNEGKEKGISGRNRRRKRGEGGAQVLLPKKKKGGKGILG